MMKKILLILWVLLLPGLSIMAMEKDSSQGIDVRIYVEDTVLYELNPYYFDLLVKREDVKGFIFNTPSLMYQNLHVNYDNMAYLKEDDPVWVSYLAYVEGANFEMYHPQNIVFMNARDEYRNYTSFKIVCFDDLGHTIYMSEVIQNEIPQDGEKRFGHIDFYAYEPYEVITEYYVHSTTVYDTVLRIIFGVLAYFGIAVVLGVIVFMVGWIKYLRRKELYR